MVLAYFFYTSVTAARKNRMELILYLDSIQVERLVETDVRLASQSSESGIYPV